LQELKLLNRRHDVVAIKVTDPVEKEWRLPVPALLEDAETGELIEFSGSSAAVRSVNLNMENMQQQSREMCRSANVDLIEIESGKDVLEPVISFFERRKRRTRS
jgi:uncharacterized protein (DUF58 family)